MIKRIISILIFTHCLVFVNCTWAQNVYVNKKAGFELLIPQGWITDTQKHITRHNASFIRSNGSAYPYMGINTGRLPEKAQMQSILENTQGWAYELHLRGMKILQQPELIRLDQGHAARFMYVEKQSRGGDIFHWCICLRRGDRFVSFELASPKNLPNHERDDFQELLSSVLWR